MLFPCLICPIYGSIEADCRRHMRDEVFVIFSLCCQRYHDIFDMIWFLMGVYSNISGPSPQVRSQMLWSENISVLVSRLSPLWSFCRPVTLICIHQQKIRNIHLPYSFKIIAPSLIQRHHILRILITHRRIPVRTLITGLSIWGRIGGTVHGENTEFICGSPLSLPILFFYGDKNPCENTFSYRYTELFSGSAGKIFCGTGIRNDSVYFVISNL